MLRETPEPEEFQRIVLAAAVARFKRMRAYLAKSEPETGAALKRTNTLFSREPKPLADLMDDFGTVAGFSDQLAVTGLVFDWAEIVGAELAEHLKIGQFDPESGQLDLIASSTAWATQVRMLIPAIQGRIDEAVGSDVVKNITVTGPKSPSWSHGKRSVKGRGPRDTYG